jgi:molybdopterin-binding protein
MAPRSPHPMVDPAECREPRRSSLVFRICGPRLSIMPQFRIRDASELLGVSDDTVRRWIDAGTLASSKDAAGRKVIDGVVLAAFAREHAANPAPDPSGVGRSARNRFVGLVTKVVADGVMAQVEMQCGPHTVVSLMSSEAARELRLEPGRLAVAVVKATTVIIETPGGAG